jgi:hypothetical protein
VTEEQLTVQRMEALAVGNARRMERAADKKKISRGQLDAAAILRRPPEHWKTAKAPELLLALPYIGRKKANWMMTLAEINPRRTLENLPVHKREALARLIDTWAERRRKVTEAITGRLP